MLIPFVLYRPDNTNGREKMSMTDKFDVNSVIPTHHPYQDGICQTVWCGLL